MSEDWTYLLPDTRKGLRDTLEYTERGGGHGLRLEVWRATALLFVFHPRKTFMFTFGPMVHGPRRAFSFFIHPNLYV